MSAIVEPLTRASESENSETETKFQSPEKTKDSSSHAESDENFDTASSSGDDDDYSEEGSSYTDEEGSGAEEGDGSVVLDLERQSGDGQEQDTEGRKKVDDDEDRSNPQYIPKKGTFYEHDDRTADDVILIEGSDDEKAPSEEPKTTIKEIKSTKKWQASQDRWAHDRFNPDEQAPKSRSELVSAYGYDIRNEDGPPRARRRKRYGRGPSKYTRNWEDEAAYSKPTQQRKPRPEDFPALGSGRSGGGQRRRYDRGEFKENIDRTGGDRRSGGGGGGDHRQSYRDYKTSHRRMPQTAPKQNSAPIERSRNYRGNQNDSRNVVNHHNTTIEYVNQSRGKESSQARQQQNQYHEEPHVPPQQRVEVQAYASRQNQVREHYVQPQQQQQQQKERPTLPVTSTPVVQSVPQLPPSAPRLPSNQELLQQQQAQLLSQQQAAAAQLQKQQAALLASQATQNYQIALNNEAARTKRYSSLRARGAPDQQPPPPSVQSQQQPAQPQSLPIMAEQQPHLLDAALLQQLQQNEKLKHIQNTMAHQKQISYHQAIQPPSTTQPAPPPYYAAPAGTTNAPPEYTAQQYTQNAAPYAYLPPQPQSSPSQAPMMSAYAQPPQQPQFQAAAQFPAYQNYAATTSNQPQAIYQTTQAPPPNIAYFPPQAGPTAQPPAPRPARRPNNAIPIVPPPDKKTEKKEEEKTEENIDHILDNMFVQRPPLQPMTTAATSPPVVNSPTLTSSVEAPVKNDGDTAASAAGGGGGSSVDAVADNVKALTIKEPAESLPLAESTDQSDQVAAVAPQADPVG